MAASVFTLAAACGDATPRSRSTGEPPDASLFDPGKGPAPGGGYYGPGSTTPVCPVDMRRCPVEFTYPYGGEASVELRGDYRGTESWQTGDAMTLQGNKWRVTVPVEPGKPVQYKFCVNGCKTGDGWKLDPDPSAKKITVQNDTNSLRDATTCDDTWICDEPPLPPAGVFDWRDAIIYFVFVDRFFDGNAGNNSPVAGVTGNPGQYQGGDFAGVTQKINSGYFDSLGVNVLWLTAPIDNADVAGKGIKDDNNYYSGYHGYWPKELDPAAPESRFGTKAELQALIDAAHAKNIRVLFDYAMVHVHQTSSVYAQHADWFYPAGCVCDVTCSWTADAKRCAFADYLPHWNYNVQAARDYSVSNAIAWAKAYGIDGFRLDAIKHVEDSWLADLRSRLTSEVVPLKTPAQRFYLVGETFSYDRNEIKYYVDPQAKLDGQFDFPLRLEIVKAVLMRQSGMDGLASFMATNDNFYGSRAVMSPFVGNHDIGRVIHMSEDTPRWNEYSNGDKDQGWSETEPPQPADVKPYERLANGFAVIMTGKGAPLIYYGDEIGLAGAGDPGNRRKMPWSGLNAHQTWLRDRITKLTKIRADHPALRRGLRQTIATSADHWLFSMTTAGDVVYVAINRSDSPKQVDLPPDTYEELVEGGSAQSSPSIPARQTRIYVKK